MLIWCLTIVLARAFYVCRWGRKHCATSATPQYTVLVSIFMAFRSLQELCKYFKIETFILFMFWHYQSVIKNEVECAINLPIFFDTLKESKSNENARASLKGLARSGLENWVSLPRSAHLFYIKASPNSRKMCYSQARKYIVTWLCSFWPSSPRYGRMVVIKSGTGQGLGNRSANPFAYLLSSNL